jgi:hypothetical protein
MHIRYMLIMHGIITETEDSPFLGRWQRCFGLTNQWIERQAITLFDKGLVHILNLRISMR